MSKDNKTIYTQDGKSIEWFPKDVNNHIDKTTLIFGATNSGKTTVIEEILFLLKDYVPNFVVIVPKTSDTAYREKMPSRCIMPDLSKTKLEAIWERQCQMTHLYKIANKKENLQSLFNRIHDKELLLKIQVINSSTESIKRKIGQDSELDFAAKKTKETKINEIYEKKLHSIYKEGIIKHYDELKKMKNQLTDNELITYEYLNLNPRLCLIIDDSTEKFETWMKYYSKGGAGGENVFEKMFYTNRHHYLTLIIAAHDDKYLKPELRKNSRVTIFTTNQTFITYINRSANGFSSNEKKIATNYSNRIFGSYDNSINKTTVNNYQKLCYIRDDNNPFKYLIANKYPDFKLCNEFLYLLNESMPKEDDEKLESNKYIKKLLN